jgi:hypothetical protein
MAMGNLAREIFSGLRTVASVQIPARESAGGIFAKFSCAMVRPASIATLTIGIAFKSSVGFWKRLAGSWGVIWGSAATIARASSTLLWAAVLFLGSLVLVRRLSINVAENPEQKVPSVLSSRAESKEVTPMALTEELVAT